MNYREQLLRNQLKKQIARDELLINTNPAAKNYKDLEQKLKEANKDLRRARYFLEKECGFTDYDDVRTKLDGQTVPVILKKLEISKDLIQILKKEGQDKDQELAEQKILYLNKLLIKDQENQENIKYYILQYHKKGKLGTKLKGRHVDELLENEINLERTIKGLTILADKRKEELAQEKQALIDLAKQKIGNKKEAKELLEKLELRRQQEVAAKNEEIKQEQEKLTGWRNTLNTFFTKVGYGSYSELEKGLKVKEEMITNLQEQNKELNKLLEQKESERLHNHKRIIEEMEKNKILQKNNEKLQGQLKEEKEKLQRFFDRISIKSLTKRKVDDLESAVEKIETLRKIVDEKTKIVDYYQEIKETVGCLIMESEGWIVISPPKKEITTKLRELEKQLKLGT